MLSQENLIKRESLHAITPMNSDHPADKGLVSNLVLITKYFQTDVIYNAD